MDVVLVMFKDDERRDFPLKEAKTIIGRRPDCHLRIPTKDVSRQHCALVVNNDTIVAKDLGSANGTFVNGKRIAESKLRPGDKLKVGPVTFVVQVNGEPRAITPHDLAAAGAASVTPTTAGAGDEETFDLTEADFDAEGDFDISEAIDVLELGEEDEDDLP